MSLVRFRPEAPPADLAHLVERDLAKVEVAGSSPVIRSNPEWFHSGFFLFPSRTHVLRIAVRSSLPLLCRPKTKTARAFSRWERIPAEKFSPFRKNLEKALDKPRTVCYNNKALSQGRACVFPRDHDKNGLVAQLVRALACHARGRGFEPHPSRHSCNFPPADLAHLVERDLAKVEVAGSSPVIRSIRRHSQAVRQRSAKPSSPVRFRVAPPKEKHPILRVPIRDYKKSINLMGTPASGKRLEVSQLRVFCYAK